MQGRQRIPAPTAVILERSGPDLDGPHLAQRPGAWQPSKGAVEYSRGTDQAAGLDNG
jgi:hypothetical protein